MTFTEAAENICPGWDGIVEVGYDMQTDTVFYVWPLAFAHYPRCAYCGRFVGWETAWTYIPFGTVLMLEPPEPEMLCRRCWDELPSMTREALLDPKRTWHPARRVREEYS